MMTGEDALVDCALFDSPTEIKEQQTIDIYLDTSWGDGCLVCKCLDLQLFHHCSDRA